MPIWRSHTLGMLVALAAGLISCTDVEPVDRLRDARDILSIDAESRLQAFQYSLLAEYDIELAVDVPEGSPVDLPRYSHDLMERHAVGSATSAARGLLLVIDVEGERVRFEVGSDLEHVYPDAFVSRIENDQMRPFFREGRVGDGVEATIELLVARVGDVLAQGADQPGAGIERGDFSAGAGATATAPIGAEDGGPVAVAEGAEYGPAASPEDALSTYLEILATRNTRPDLGLYTVATRQLLSNRPITRAQQDNEHRVLASKLFGVHYVVSDSFAVALFDAADVPPYFLRRGSGGWMLDLAALAESIRFDHNNRWFFIKSAGPYGFAFE